MTAAGVRFERVNVSRGGRPVVRDLTARVPAGAVTALVGPNGAGKSTLLAAMLGFLPFGGRIRYEDADGAARPARPRVGYVPQRFAPDPHLPLTAEEFLACCAQRRALWLFGARRTVRARARALLDAVGVGGVARRPLGVLSGGERQRVLLANALQRDPELLILDEPDAGVDAGGEGLFCELLEGLRARRGFTQLMVSHNIPLVAAHAAHIVLMNHTRLAEGDPADALAPEELQNAFGVHMVLPMVRARGGRDHAAGAAAATVAPCGAAAPGSSPLRERRPPCP